MQMHKWIMSALDFRTRAEHSKKMTAKSALGLAASFMVAAVT